MQKYTDEQIKDIQARELECLNFLKEKEMNVAASPRLVNLGDDVFAIKIIPFINDTKYADQVSPIQAEDVAKKD